MDDYQKYLNQYNVIYIDFSRMTRDCTDYQQYISRIQDGINLDLAEAYPDMDISVSGTVWDILLAIFQKTGDKFIFVLDEWDAVFHMSFIEPKMHKD